jgi:hypothetical protein
MSGSDRQSPGCKVLNSIFGLNPNNTHNHHRDVHVSLTRIWIYTFP